MTPAALSDTSYTTLSDVWWPEIKHRRPVTEEKQVKVAIGLIGKVIVTVSPIIILTMLREVRVGRMSCTDLNIYCDGKLQAVDDDGEFINKWPGGFSRTKSHLLFGDE
jgi:hypothetical protein